MSSRPPYIWDYNIDEAQFRKILAGRLTIGRLEGNEPIVEIKPVTTNGKRLRPYALCAGEFQTPEDFDAPLPDEIIEQFEG